MLGREVDGDTDVCDGVHDTLTGKPVHQIEVDVVEARSSRRRERAPRLGAVVDSAQARQAGVVETLDTE